MTQPPTGPPGDPSAEPPQGRPSGAENPYGSPLPAASPAPAYGGSSTSDYSTGHPASAPVARPAGPAAPEGSSTQHPGYSAGSAASGAPSGPAFPSGASSTSGPVFASGPEGPGAPGGLPPGGPSGPTGGAGPGGPAGPSGPSGPSGAAGRPANPNLINGATRHGIMGRKGIRHPAELPLLWVGVGLTILAYIAWWVLIISTVVLQITEGEETVASLWQYVGILPIFVQLAVILPLFPLLAWWIRAIMYAQLRSSAVRMSPTQFPEGYRMVVEAAHEFGLRRVPRASSL